MVKEAKQIGVVSNYFEKIGVASIKLTAGLKVGDKIKVVGGEVDFEHSIKGMQINREEIKKAKKGNEVGVKIKEKFRKGYNIFKI